MSLFRDCLPRVWFTSGHGDLWGCDSTYCPVPYELLPKLHRIAEDFSWLDDMPHESFSATLNADENNIDHLEQIISTAEGRGLQLPAEFIRFIANSELHRKVPTCTACFLELSDSLIPVPSAENTYVLRFMNDSQSCVMWYLLLHPRQPACVLASSYFFEPEIFEVLAHEEDEPKYEEVFHHAAPCAESFLDFIYRFWIENAIWFADYDGRPLSPREADYKNQIKQKP